MFVRQSIFVVFALSLLSTIQADEPAKITHAFLATGGETYIQNGDGKAFETLRGLWGLSVIRTYS